MIAKLCQWIGAATLIVLVSEFLAHQEESWISRSKAGRSPAARSSASPSPRSYALTPAGGWQDKDRAFRIFSKN